MQSLIPLEISCHRPFVPGKQIFLNESQLPKNQPPKQNHSIWLIKSTQEYAMKPASNTGGLFLYAPLCTNVTLKGQYCSSLFCIH